MPGTLRDFWTEERMEMLRSMAGFASAKTIGERLGCSRNAVLGKADRMGVNMKVNRELKAAATEKDTPAPRPPATQEKMFRAERIRRLQEATEKEVVVSVTTSEPVGPGVEFLEMTDSQCLWPVGGTLRCGEPKVGRRYCAHHAELGRMKPAKGGHGPGNSKFRPYLGPQFNHKEDVEK